MIHLYALTDDAGLVPADGPNGPSADGLSWRGIDGAHVSVVAVEGLHAVVSEHPHPPRADVTTARAHAAVIAELHTSHPTLPVRFGSHHEDVQALQAHVGRDRTQLVDALDRVRDRAEFVVRVAVETVGGTDHLDDPPDGRAYLQGRLEVLQAERASQEGARQQVRQLTDGLDRLAVEVLERTTAHGCERTFLVERAQVEGFHAAVSGLAIDRSDLVIAGPWPPYSFAAPAVPA